MTNTQRTRMISLFVVLMLVCSTEANLDSPAICYMLDGILLLYCLVMTAMFINAKYCQPTKTTDDHIYQDLQRELSHDDQIIEHSDNQARKKKKRQVDASLRSMDAYESLASGSSAPRALHR